jgi:ribosome-associated protein
MAPNGVRVFARAAAVVHAAQATHKNRGSQIALGDGFLENKEIDSQKKMLLVINALLEKKAADLVVLNVREISAFADYFVICSGSSDRQVRAIAASLKENLKKSDIFPLGIEGETEGKWALLDYDDVIVHVFLDSIRVFYDLERLWSEAPRMAIPESALSLSALPQEM